MPTLLSLMIACGYAIDDMAEHVVETATSSSVVITNLDNDTTGASPQRYDDVYVTIMSGAAALQCRRVRPGGFTANTHTLLIARDWVTTPSAGQVVLLSRLFPGLPGVQGERVDDRTLINRALSMLVRPRRVSTSATTSRDHPITTWPWLDRPERLVDVLEASPVSGGRLISAKWRGPRLNLNADTPSIELKAPFTTAAALTLDTLSPAQTWIRTSGTWAETSPSTGLVNPGDECLPSEADVIPVFRMLAMRALLSRQPGLLEAFQDAREEARRVRYYDRSLEVAMGVDRAPSQEAA